MIPAFAGKWVEDRNRRCWLQNRHVIVDVDPAKVRAQGLIDGPSMAK